MTAKLSFLKGSTPEFNLETYKLKERIRTPLRVPLSNKISWSRNKTSLQNLEAGIKQHWIFFARETFFY
jgi:hypothetical protein